MTNLVTTTKNTITSMEVAMMLQKEHHHLLRDIARYCKQLIQINEASVGETKIGLSDFFQESSYMSEQNKVCKCYNVTRKGCEFLANKLTGVKGTEFTARYVNRFHELEEGNFSNSLLSAVNGLSQSVEQLVTHTAQTEKSILDLYERMNSLEEKQTLPTQYKKPYNPWFTKMQPKYQLLENYFHITRGALYRNILMELENLYDIDTNQIQSDYLYEHNLQSCYPLDPYEFKPEYRKIIESIVNDSLIKYGIASKEDPITSTRHITIFDTPVDKQFQN